ncbi:C39 family peptidase [Paenibacillus macerans]|uniref:C39 family peptidase n=1 Tax=Paenibacillus macerans TaxID=44252 RepID=UPI002DBA45CC|nr:C39 family peptidase [Paenibacillus macerans]MEC0328666.1 C39 family peptidase [Paenibacillus macerans]
MNVVYYSQEDPRWKSVLYTSDGDADETIGASGCGPTSFAMAASTYLGKTILPTETCHYALRNGYRTANSGTAWGFFASAAEHYGLKCEQTGSLSEVKAALRAGKLVIASMGPGRFTGGGHFILLVGIREKGGVTWIDVHDPNHDNRRYGSDGLIEQGVRNDGKVAAQESVFAREAKQYWIIYGEGDEAMTAEEKAKVGAMEQRLAALEEKAKMAKIPAWALAACENAKKAGVLDTTADGSYDFYRMVTVLDRAGIFKEAK